ncbi:MAG: phosphoglycolate phosphatase [Pseudomonadota bacterium]
MTAIIFDLDGTLVESAPVIQGVANTLMSELGHRDFELSEVHDFIGDGTRVFLERAFATLGVEYGEDAFEQHHTRLVALHAAVPGSASEPMPGADQVLRQLHSDGFAVGMCTNKPGAATHNIIEAQQWAGIITSVVAGDTLPERKPDPKPLITATKQLDHDHAIFVGDSEVDEATARAAGFPFLFFTEGYCEADIDDLTFSAKFSHYDELLPLIQKIKSEQAR